MLRGRISIPLFAILLIPLFLFGMTHPAFSRSERHHFLMEVQKDSTEARKSSTEIRKDSSELQKGSRVVRDSFPSLIPRMNDSLRLDSISTWGRFSREEVSPEIKFKLSGNRLIIENIPTDGMVEVYNIMGAKILQQKVRAGSAEISLSVPRGYYIIKIDKFSRKIAIK